MYSSASEKISADVWLGTENNSKDCNPGLMHPAGTTCKHCEKELHSRDNVTLFLTSFEMEIG